MPNLSNVLEIAANNRHYFLKNTECTSRRNCAAWQWLLEIILDIIVIKHLKETAISRKQLTIYTSKNFIIQSISVITGQIQKRKINLEIAEKLI